jgi:hypothetical protein
VTVAPIIVVSGLPRSGTSLMMKMLAAGGVELLTDGLRAADEDNPDGYFELEAVKKTKSDPAWLERAPGRAVKVISELLDDLPDRMPYRVIFMRRRIEEVLASQRQMLERLRGEARAEDDAELRRLYLLHLEETMAKLDRRPELRALYVSYNRLIEAPRAHAERIAAFLDRGLDLPAMERAVDPRLYRKRR